LRSVDAAPPSSCDLAVVGAGIVGLAVARELGRRHPRSRVCVLERAHAIGSGQTGRNSGVIHAGIYYPPGSLKARLCVEGARAMYALCADRDIAHERCGKLIVATRPSELDRLDALERRGRANGVPGLRRVGPEGIRELEPAVSGPAGLHSPATGIVDFAAVARALADDVRADGGSVVGGCEVARLVPEPRGLRLEHGRGTLRTAHAVLCAGHQADRLARRAGASADPRIVPFRGAYATLRAARRGLVRGLIYPVPDPALPFLGVHLTRHMSGDVLVGPTALLVPRGDTLTWPGTWRMARRWWRTGLTELRLALSRGALAAEAARFVPELGPDDLERGWAGTRAQALARDGRLLDDFAFSVTHRAVHVRNAPSPGATSALAIARLVADRVDARFDLA
jgi:L-2-hydroxyglutarate oxidase